MKQKKQIVVLVVLVAAGALVWVFQWRGQTSSLPPGVLFQDDDLLAVPNPQIHWQELERAQKTEYKSNGRNPFSIGVAPTPDRIRVAITPKMTGPPAPPPTPPPPTEAHLPGNLKFFGFGTVGNGAPRLAFFYDGEDEYIVSEGDTLLGRYRILKIGNTNLQFQEISTGLPGTTPLDEQAAPPSV
jgi:hypothetical protein